MKNLLHYREHTDPNRRDEMEGVTSIQAKGGRVVIRSTQTGKPVFEGVVSGDIRRQTVDPERYFISCFSTQCKTSHRKWGSWVVALHEPESLFREMSLETPRGFTLIWGPVEYSELPTHHSSLEKQDSWRRKRMSYSDESEFRLVLHVAAGQLRSSDEFTLVAAMKSGEAEVFQDF